MGEQALKKKQFGKVVMISLLLSPVLQTYGWGKYDVASLLTLSLAIVGLLLFKASSKKMPKWVCVYLAFWYFSHLLANEFPSSLFPLGIIRIFLTYLVFYDFFELPFFLNQYRKISSFFLFFFAIQTFSRFILGKTIVGVFTFLPIATSDLGEFSSHILDSPRDSAFFSEPAHFVQFLLPLLAIELLYYKRKSWARIVAIVLALLIMQSGNAVIGLLIIGVFYFLSYHQGKFTTKKLFGFLGVVVAVALAGYLYINSSMGANLLQRQETISSNSIETQGYAGSAFMRIYRGYYIFRDYPLLQKFIGNDNNDYIKAVIAKSEYSWTFYDETYVNAVQAFLIYTGIVGTIFFVLFFITQWRRTNYCGKTIMAILLALSFVASLHFTLSMALYLLIPFGMPKET